MPFSEMEQHAGQAVAMLKMLANKHRLLLLCILQSGEKSVSELNALVTIPQSTLSQHLAFLRRENLVCTRRDAQTIYYSLADKKVIPIVSLLHQLYCQ
ncbi:ArsR/SmtB family transcription factor [Planctobacterium marinum]|uniref:ArsR/SmtB family transcription factor n=1 Tax=Planctobacterium marinum TaxID=1631968 RepID=UPI001E567B8C|nr:metalloregulator ArsR/SmtB family transcription factor [Planctobacterium marinum]MCC2604304.1 metalloregulator ArsR/SmtB family transcription factor [Planctobacterium marinum]